MIKILACIKVSVKCVLIRVGVVICGFAQLISILITTKAIVHSEQLNETAVRALHGHFILSFYTTLILIFISGFLFDRKRQGCASGQTDSDIGK